MTKHLISAFATLVLLAACAEPVPQRMGPDGRPIPVVYRIGSEDREEIQVRMRDAISTVRAQQGLPPVELNAELTSAAATHARDMSIQSRPWHFGSDGSSPIDRVERVGYDGHFLGELISETYETELETLTAWLEQRETRAVLLEPRMREIGFAWHQESNGKLWWTLTTGTPQDEADGPALSRDETDESSDSDQG
ncbi:MAG: hypothetical protein HLUCCA12_07980 [Rhodobacteraceae bacterium HLUCCA12]|nr:MAG: hypothetical protein HLUCCA12_07980 [Rhodobacteraceae bacterium HLUCCA12]